MTPSKGGAKLAYYWTDIAELLWGVEVGLTCVVSAIEFLSHMLCFM